jgi:hypothetical protein
MNQYSNTINASNHWQQLRQSLTQTASFFKGCSSKIQNGLSRFMANLQLGRMETVLSKMSDKQLEQAGIKRSDIKSHAKYLVEYEYDGL